MSELSEIRKELAAIRDTTSRTAQDVNWIRDGMQRGAARMDGHDRRITKMEHGNFRTMGFAAGVAAVFGTAVGLIGSKIGWPAPHP